MFLGLIKKCVFAYVWINRSLQQLQGANQYTNMHANQSLFWRLVFAASLSYVFSENYACEWVCALFLVKTILCVFLSFKNEFLHVSAQTEVFSSCRGANQYTTMHANNCFFWSLVFAASLYSYVFSENYTCECVCYFVFS